MITRIFLDMDGVLADFDQGFRRAFGVNPREFEDEFGPEEFWLQIYKNPDFFLNLPRANNIRQLLEKCQSITKDIVILSAPSRTNQSLCVSQKRRWIDARLGTQQPAIFEAKKEMYARPGVLLIDDSKNKVQKFREAGGFGILYDMHDWDRFESDLNDILSGKKQSRKPKATKEVPETKVTADTLDTMGRIYGIAASMTQPTSMVQAAEMSLAFERIKRLCEASVTDVLGPRKGRKMLKECEKEANNELS